MKLLNRLFQTNQLTELTPSEAVITEIPPQQFSPEEQRFYRALQLVSNQTAQLSRQIFRALEIQHNFLTEIEQRTNKLDTELKQANAYLSSSNATVGALQAQIDVEVSDVNTAVGDAMQQISHTLSDKAHSVNDVLDGILEIGKGVNMLALNAAIEAARAGSMAGALPWWPMK